jgi:hypothetical protein
VGECSEHGRTLATRGAGAVANQGAKNVTIGNFPKRSAVRTRFPVLTFHPPASRALPNQPFDRDQIWSPRLTENRDPSRLESTSSGPASLSIAEDRFHGRTDYSDAKKPSHAHILALPTDPGGTRLLITDSICPTYEE